MITTMDNKNKDSDAQQGFITMIILMLFVLGAVVYFAYQNVANR
jgi:hypothetical protein